MTRRRPLAHPVPTGQTNLPIKLHGENAPALPAAGKGQSGRLLRRPQRAYPAATVADFCTAVSIRAAFVLDAHDREVIAWRATVGAGISGSDIRDMMLEAVEVRFGGVRAPHPVEWLSDNGSIYTARETRVFATQLNLVPCFTPVASPESNGMSEAFVKTLKRDYLRVRPVPDARTALDQIAGWFDDYNENHPHSGLRMRSPREFRRAHQPAEVSG